jgi:hypothetical protein
MIGFGELRRLSAQWQIDLTQVERAYALDWLVKAIFDHAILSRALILRASAALWYAHCADYPRPEHPEFLLTQSLDIPAALIEAIRVSREVRFMFVARARGIAQVEYTGPLGRRSAAQPRLTLSFVPGQSRLPPARVPLLHRFSDACAATVQAIALDELVAERLATITRHPRARDVFDLWFVLTHARAKVDLAHAHAIAREKKQTLPHADWSLDPALARVWDAALRDVRDRPTLAQVENDLHAIFSTW